jgi:hypothetical protein
MNTDSKLLRGFAVALYLTVEDFDHRVELFHDMMLEKKIKVSVDPDKDRVVRLYDMSSRAKRPAFIAILPYGAPQHFDASSVHHITGTCRIEQVKAGKYEMAGPSEEVAARPEAENTALHA